MISFVIIRCFGRIIPQFNIGKFSLTTTYDVTLHKSGRRSGRKERINGENKREMSKGGGEECGQWRRRVIQSVTEDGLRREERWIRGFEAGENGGGGECCQ